jgi:hypothetical protein
MNTLDFSLVNSLVFIFGITISFLFRNSIFIHIENETRERKKMMEMINAKDQESSTRLTLLEKNSEEMKDVIGRLNSDYVSARDLTRSIEGFVTYPMLKANLGGLESNLEDMKDIVGRLHANMVTVKDLERSTEGYMTYPSIKELIADVKETILTESQEKAANMIFQSEAIQRRRMELVRKALEALTGHATQFEIAGYMTREDVSSFMRAELAGYATRFDIAAIQEAEDKLTAFVRSSLVTLQDRIQSTAAAAAAAAAATAVPAVPSGGKQPEYYQGWMAAAETNGIKAEVELCNIQLRTKEENKAWLDEENKDAIANREAFMSELAGDPSGWKQGATSDEYVKYMYKAGEWSTGVKAEYKLTFPPAQAPVTGLPPPPRDGSMCRNIFNKLMPLLTWERVLLSVDSA